MTRFAVMMMAVAASAATAHAAPPPQPPRENAEAARQLSEVIARDLDFRQYASQAVQALAWELASASTGYSPHAHAKGPGKLTEKRRARLVAYFSKRIEGSSHEHDARRFGYCVVGELIWSDPEHLRQIGAFLETPAGKTLRDRLISFSAPQCARETLANRVSIRDEGAWRAMGVKPPKWPPQIP
jgi:hypothetical protein